ncbi:MAG: ferritin [Verrucomicrobiota bacterium]
MEPTITNAINDQANHELFSALCYQALAYWCEDREFNGYADFFKQQADEERLHADMFFRHLLDRDVKPMVAAIAAPKNDFATLREVTEYAQSLEYANSKQIQACYELSLEAKDYASQPFLLEFIKEQVEEEAWTNKMVTLTRRAECSGSVYSLDRHIVRELVDTPAE